MRALVGALAGLAVLAGCEADRDGPRPPPADPGAPTAGRLNRAEYDATVRDLLGTDKTPARAFPVDESVHGFDNIGAALTTSSHHVEAWELAAADLLDEMFGLDPERTERVVVEAEGPGVTYTGGWSVGSADETFWALSSGGMSTEFVVDGDGRFAVRARVLGHVVRDEAPRLLVRIDERYIDTVEVPASDEPVVVQIDTPLPAGAHRIEIGLANPGSDGNGARRTIAIDYIEIEGPLDPEGRPTAARDRYVPCAQVDRPCAEAAVASFGLRALRRPLAPDDIAQFMGLYDAGMAAHADGDKALALAFRAVLLSPEFLFAIERPPRGAGRRAAPRRLRGRRAPRRLSCGRARPTTSCWRSPRCRGCSLPRSARRSIACWPTSAASPSWRTSPGSGSTSAPSRRSRPTGPPTRPSTIPCASRCSGSCSCRPWTSCGVGSICAI